MLKEHATCKIELFVTITIGKVALADNIAHTVSTYEFIVFCVSSLWSDLVSVGSSFFQVVPTCSRWFQFVLHFSMHA